MSASATDDREQRGSKAELTPAQGRCEAKTITQSVFRWENYVFRWRT
jgi:hypothetical protein